MGIYLFIDAIISLIVSFHFLSVVFTIDMLWIALNLNILNVYLIFVVEPVGSPIAMRCTSLTVL